jgi:Fic family protein
MKKSLYYKKSGEFRWITDVRFPYYTFIPNPLNGDSEIEIDAELSTLLSTANRLLGQLDGMSGLLPNAEAIESIFLHKEALLSCQIDEFNMPFYDVIDATKKADKQNHTIYSYISAMKYGLNKSNGLKYNNTLLCDVHNELMVSDVDENNGCFRKEQIFLKRVRTNTEHYNPTAPGDINLAMINLEEFINRKNNFDALIKVALAHYQFETIHPFMSGNGRIGRILSYLILSYTKILSKPLLCLSHYLIINKVEYIDRMESIRNCSYDYEQWVKFFINAIIYAAEDSVNRIKKWLRIREKNIKRIENSNKTVKAIRKIYDIIELYPIVDVNTIAGKAEISYNTSASALKILSNLKIIKQSNNMERNRDYAYVDFLNCFVDDIMELSV